MVTLCVFFTGYWMSIDCKEELARAYMDAWKKAHETGDHKIVSSDSGMAAFHTGAVVGMYFIPVKPSSQEKLANAQAKIADVLTKQASAGDDWKGQ